MLPWNALIMRLAKNEVQHLFFQLLSYLIK